MYRKNSVNINELINRFEGSDDDFAMSENVKYVKVTRPMGKMYAVQDDADDDDENSLMKYNEKFLNRNKNRSMNAKEMTKHTIAMLLSRISAFLEMVSKFPFPRMSVMSFGLTSLLAIFICPRGLTERALYPGFRIIFSIIYPAYRSFKAVRNKNLKEYLKWIVYWIVYAFFTCIELIADALLNWFPFFFEIKVIFFIWLLGPSSRGAMKIYKTCIHPMLISREQEIDDIIQIAQDRGYMHVFRLGSRSVNYANKIIMQETTTPDNNLVLSHQLMKNISLSNLSDADTIHSNDDTEDLRLRKFSSENFPSYGNQFNYFEQRRKPSVDFRCDEISSGYSSPSSPTYFRHFPMRSQAYIEHEEDKMYYRNLSRNPPSSNHPETEKHPSHLDDANLENPRRKASINELSDDEIAFAYNKLIAQKNSIATNASSRNEDLSSDLSEEFRQWMESRRKDEKLNPVTSKSEKSAKVNIIEASREANDVVNVAKLQHDAVESFIKQADNLKDIDKREETVDKKSGTENVDDDIKKKIDKNPVNLLRNDEETPKQNENLNRKSDDFVVKNENFDKNVDSSPIQRGNVDESTQKSEMISEKPEDFSKNPKDLSKEVERNVQESDKLSKRVENFSREFQNSSKKLEEFQEAKSFDSNKSIEDFDEFKDVISDHEEQDDKEYLKVPLVILEDGDGSKEKVVDNLKTCQDVPLIPTVVESNLSNKTVSTGDDVESEQIIDVKLTLSNSPLEVKTSLSSSNLSLASNKSGDEAVKKRPATHSKGRAPPPPVIPGHHYDHEICIPRVK